MMFDHQDAKDYLPLINVPDGALRHVRLKESTINKTKCAAICDVIKDNLTPSVHSRADRRLQEFLTTLLNETEISFYMDVMIAKCYYFTKLQPPFGNIDFECNALLLTTNGINISAQLYPDLAMSEVARFYKLQAIIEDIKVKRAVYSDPSALKSHRIAKMREKGWTTTLKHVIQEAAADERCIICHDDVDSIHFRLACCNARYHRKCLLLALGSDGNDSDYSMMKSGKCIMCKQVTQAAAEIPLLLAS
jgi:hypothetical protein